MTVISLRTRKRQVGGTELRAKIGSTLARLAAQIARGDVDPEPVGAVVILLADRQAPQVTWAGGLTLSEIDDGLSIVQRGLWQIKRRPDDEPNDVIRDAWETRTVAAAYMEDERRAARAAVPWQCEWCERNFKTERGARQHEGGCWRNPRARRYVSGEFIAYLDEAGRVYGHEAASARRRGA